MPHPNADLIPNTGNLLRSSWRPFEVEFGQYVDRMRTNTIAVEHEAFACTVKLDAVRFAELKELMLHGPTKRKAALPCHCLAYSANPYFYGRENILKNIKKNLPSERYNQQRSYAIWGMGGVGKTQIALAYAHNCLESFDAVLWVHADSTLKLMESFSKIGAMLKITEPGSDAEKCKDAVLDWLVSTGI